MTRIIEVEKQCAVCGSNNTYSQILSSICFGFRDLDRRPPMLQRLTINFWVNTCPSCGYCSRDISKIIGNASKIVYSDYYQKQLNNPEFPELANKFLCLSLLYENNSNYPEAGRACLHAAWACDDVAAYDCAQTCRQKAISLLLTGKEKGQNFAEKRGEEIALLVDLMRRSKQFEVALKTCEEGLKKHLNKDILCILEFQRKLIMKQDCDCHKISEAIKKQKTKRK